MKKNPIIVVSSIVFAIIAFLLLAFLVPKNDNPSPKPEDKVPEKKKPITIKEETIEEEDITKMILNLNNTKHIFTIVKGLDGKSTVTFDKLNILSYIANESDFKVHQKIKGDDGKYYFVFALANNVDNAYNQYLYILNDEGKSIFELNEEGFGIAFTNIENQTESFIEDLYGNTGRVKIENNKVIYLTYYNYTEGMDYVEYQENIIHINDGLVTEEKGEILKVLMTGAGA